ncbi:MAG: hypothetical protein OXN83_05720, partial [Oligoflexia bacterium]|nr:hypothetical protein [Oligoflexia bacterium]
MRLIFESLGKPKYASTKDWFSWKWQIKNIQTISSNRSFFLSGATPYYLRLIEKETCLKPIIEVSQEEFKLGYQSLKDPLGEEKHSPFSRLIH